MKKFWKFMMFAALGVFTMASCEDVPEPYIIPGNSSTPEQEVEPTGDGTATSPFNVKAVQAFIEEGDYANKEVYIEGIITSFKEAPGNQYGNATFYIADTPAGKNTFYIYRTYGLNGEKFTDASNLAVGDTVVIRSTVTNYNGTLETEQNKGRIISINGKTEYPGGNGNNNDEGEENAEPTGEGTLESPYNVAAVINYINTLGADKESANEVYVKGIVKANSTTEATISQYGNMTFTMVDEGSNTTFTAFQVYGPGKKKFTSVDQIKEGDEVIVCGKVVNFKGNTPETVGKGASYVYSINGKSEGQEDPTPSEPSGVAKGDGTLSNPFNPIAANEYVANGGDSSKEVYVKGIISRIKSIDVSKYTHAQYYISEDGTASNEFYVYNGLYLDGADFTANDQIKVGDEVIVCGTLTNYNGTFEFAQNSKIVSLNGKNTNENDNDSNPNDNDPTTNVGDNITVTMSSYGFADKQPVTGGSFNGITLNFSQEDGKTAPAYYANTNPAFDAARLYANNSITISTEKKISTIIIQCATKNGSTVYTGNETMTAVNAEGTSIANTLDSTAETRTFTNVNSKSLKITNTFSTNSGGVQLRIVSIKVTFAE